MASSGGPRPSHDSWRDQTRGEQISDVEWILNHGSCNPRANLWCRPAALSSLLPLKCQEIYITVRLTLRRKTCCPTRFLRLFCGRSISSAYTTYINPYTLRFPMFYTRLCFSLKRWFAEYSKCKCPTAMKHPTLFGLPQAGWHGELPSDHQNMLAFFRR